VGGAEPAEGAGCTEKSKPLRPVTEVPVAGGMSGVDVRKEGAEVEVNEVGAPDKKASDEVAGAVDAGAGAVATGFVLIGGNIGAADFSNVSAGNVGVGVDVIDAVDANAGAGVDTGFVSNAVGVGFVSIVGNIGGINPDAADVGTGFVSVGATVDSGAGIGAGFVSAGTRANDGLCVGAGFVSVGATVDSGAGVGAGVGAGIGAGFVSASTRANDGLCAGFVSAGVRENDGLGAGFASTGARANDGLCAGAGFVSADAGVDAGFVSVGAMENDTAGVDLGSCVDVGSGVDSVVHVGTLKSCFACVESGSAFFSEPVVNAISVVASFESLGSGTLKVPRALLVSAVVDG
jgi:hypothetical protein